MTDGSRDTSLRWCRAALIAFVGTGSGAAAHVSAGGILPGVPSLVLLVVTLTAVCAVLVGRVASRFRVVALVLTGQTFIHVTFSALTGHGAMAPSSMSGSGMSGHSMAGHGGMAMPMASGPPAAMPAPDGLLPGWLSHALPDPTGPDAAMTLAHLGAGAVLGLWLAAGERVLFTVLALLAGALVRFLRVVVQPPAPVRTLAAVLRPASRRPELLLTHSIGRRGPPLPA